MIFKSMVGAGLFALPFAFKLLGFGGGIIAMAICGALTWYTNVLIVRVHDVVVRDTLKRDLTYVSLGERPRKIRGRRSPRVRTRAPRPLRSGAHVWAVGRVHRLFPHRLHHYRRQCGVPDLLRPGARAPPLLAVAAVRLLPAPVADGKLA